MLFSKLVFKFASGNKKSFPGGNVVYLSSCLPWLEFVMMGKGVEAQTLFTVRSELHIISKSPERYYLLRNLSVDHRCYNILNFKY